MMMSLFKPFLHDRFLHLLVVLGVILACFVPFRLTELPQAVDWPTMIILCGLLMLTKGIEASGYFDMLGRRLLQQFEDQRRLALFLVSAAALLSTFLTNDVALFIVVPLTLSLCKYSSLPIARLIIFEALAVNAGSLLTPIGNPQNILLWRHGTSGFGAFIWQMMPLALWLFFSLLILTACCFSARKIKRHSPQNETPWQRRLLFICALLYVLFIITLELDVALWGLMLVLATWLVLARRLLLSIDWSLLAVFIVMFIDVFLFSRLPLVQSWLPTVNQLPEGGQFMLAAGLSQVMSNVPATILLLGNPPPSVQLAWAVNIGGFGLLPGSLANLIALRMAQESRIWWRFHYYSLPVLGWSLLSGWGLYVLIYRI